MVEGIEKYLGSGTIRGIGPVYAKKLVGAFGAAGMAGSGKSNAERRKTERLALEVVGCGSFRVV